MCRRSQSLAASSAHWVRSRPRWRYCAAWRCAARLGVMPLTWQRYRGPAKAQRWRVRLWGTLAAAALTPHGSSHALPSRACWEDALQKVPDLIGADAGNPALIRCTPESGHVQCNSVCLLCANSGTACSAAKVRYSISSSAIVNKFAGILRPSALLGEQIEQANEKKDNKTVNELSRDIDPEF